MHKDEAMHGSAVHALHVSALLTVGRPATALHACAITPSTSSVDARDCAAWSGALHEAALVRGVERLGLRDVEPFEFAAAGGLRAVL